MTLGKKGDIQWTGVLAGRCESQPEERALSTDGIWPLYSFPVWRLWRRFDIGWMQLTNGNMRDISGSAVWIVPAKQSAPCIRMD